MYTSSFALPFTLLLEPEMYAIALIRYRRPLDEVQTALDAHRAYLRSLQEKGLLIAAGPLDPWTGGALLLRVPDNAPQAALDQIRDGDPYTQKGFVQYEVWPWKPVLGKEALDGLQ
jgi:uncharacterized protein YciI